MDLTSFENNLFILLFLAAVLHSLYLATLLFLKSRKEKGLICLGLMMIPISFWLLNYLLYIGEFILKMPHLYGLFAPGIYLIGPFYYFFIVSSSNDNYRFRWYDLLHLIPCLYIVFELVPVYVLPAETKLNYIEGIYNYRPPNPIEILKANRSIFLMIAYVLASYIYLKNIVRQKKWISPRLLWLQGFNRYFGLLLLLNMVIKVIFIGFKWDGVIMELSLILILAFAIHVLGYVILGKDKVLPELIFPVKKSRYATSPLGPEQIKAYQQQIVQYLESERPWLDPKFSIHDLAKGIKLPRHHISQVLSDGLQTSFFDLLCNYRIAEVKKRFLRGDIQQYSIMGIAFNSGFKSKSSFNRAFKKVCGMTPTAWLKEINQQGVPEK